METYRRSQVDWALWQAFSRHKRLDPRRRSVPPIFTTRIRKFGALGVPFSEEERPGRQGLAGEYTSVDAFIIGVALVLQDIGLKLAEVAYFVRHTKDQLRSAYEEIMRAPPLLKAVPEDFDYPNRPHLIYIEGDDPKRFGNPSRKNIADTAYYMSFRYIELQEALDERIRSAPTDWPGTGRPPMFLRPKFFSGALAAAEELENMAAHAVDPRIIVELSHLAARLTQDLPNAPLLKRGRK